MASGGARAVEHLLLEIGKTEETRRVELLASLKTAMGSLTRVELVDQMGSLNLEVLFECLASENREQIQSTCEILRNLMTSLDPVDSLQKYHESILQGFYHPVPDVPALVVAHLTRCIDSSESSLVNYPDLVKAAISQLVSEELSAAGEAARFLMKYGNLKEGKEFLLSADGINAFKVLVNDSSINDSKRFRVYENLVNLSTISAEHFGKLDEALGLMRQMITLSFETNDVLGQMNALEIISTLVGCPHGHEALRAAGVFDKINRVGQDWQNASLGHILIPGVLKFIGKVGAVQLPPEELIQIVINALLESGKDLPLATVAVEALAYIGTTLEGKRNLKARGEIRRCFEKIREIIEDSPTEFRSRSLEAMAILFGSDEANEDCLPHWFNILFRDISYLFDLTRLPFPEIRLSGLNFLAAIAHLEWAQRHYLRGAGVLEYLVTRQVEPEKECVQAKFRLVSIIADSPSAAQILSPEDMARLKLYVHQGPYYAQPIPIVATEGGGD